MICGASRGCFRTGFRDVETSILHVALEIFDFAPSIPDLGRDFSFASEPIFMNPSFQLRPVVSPIRHDREIERNDFVLALRVNASKNLHFLRVVASLLANGSGEVVQNGAFRVGGAIVEM